MLVLSRKVNQQIGIGNDIKVFVIAVHGDRVRLGFSAPEDCRSSAKKCADCRRRTTAPMMSIRRIKGRMTPVGRLRMWAAFARVET